MLQANDLVALAYAVTSPMATARRTAFKAQGIAIQDWESCDFWPTR